MWWCPWPAVEGPHTPRGHPNDTKACGSHQEPYSNRQKHWCPLRGWVLCVRTRWVRKREGSLVLSRGAVTMLPPALTKPLSYRLVFEGICDQRTDFLKVSLPHRYRAAREESLASPAAAVVSRYTKEIQSLWTRKRK